MATGLGGNPRVAEVSDFDLLNKYERLIKEGFIKPLLDK
jgi:hypothetical protein